MGYTVCFWGESTADADETHARLLDGDVSTVTPHPDVARLRADVLARWPELGETVEPWSPDLGDPVTGPEGLESHYLLLNLSWDVDADVVEQICARATELGLVVHDPENEEEPPEEPGFLARLLGRSRRRQGG
ncbi:hypothetical protein KZX45_12455 [Georgenia sp. EYE_87]|uniref:hypothetical protein n=1 Tax=Georgenia sp. EYE_87 TaxID=2853448 RepID=UPI0020048049|nr:hypothetical protein [Georgenia sp. EYE_87]MCK6211354.1 hypothetical protein [Georgenia sp. EYE_87]